MEEALQRQADVPSRHRVLNEETLASATSMSDLALRSKLDKAVAQADGEGKRSFEIYGRIESGKPPFGRDPNIAKLEVVNFSDRDEFYSAGTSSSSIDAFVVVLLLKRERELRCLVPSSLRFYSSLPCNA
jgi:hypothetical protein